MRIAQGSGIRGLLFILWLEKEFSYTIAVLNFIRCPYTYGILIETVVC